MQWLCENFEIQKVIWENPDKSCGFYQILRKDARLGFDVFSRKMPNEKRFGGLFLYRTEKEDVEKMLQKGSLFRTRTRPFLAKCVDCNRIPEKGGVYFHFDGGKEIMPVSAADFRTVLEILQEVAKEDLPVGCLTPRRFWKVDGVVQLLPDETWGETMTLGLEMEELLRSWEIPPLTCRRRENRYFFQWEKPLFGQLRLFAVNRTLPQALRQQSFWAGKIPDTWAGEIVAAGEGCEVELPPHQIERILPILDGGGIGRMGRVFRVGGPEEVTLRQYYFDEGDLVLEFNWPETIYHAILLFRHDRFAHGVRDGRVFTHERSNPLIPKRISLEEFRGWPQIYLQIYSRVRTSSGDLFSIGRRAGSRLVVSREAMEE